MTEWVLNPEYQNYVPVESVDFHVDRKRTLFKNYFQFFSLSLCFSQYIYIYIYMYVYMPSG